jgi:hypothetical protein
LYKFFHEKLLGSNKSAQNTLTPAFESLRKILTNHKFSFCLLIVTPSGKYCSIFAKEVSKVL